jgi:hypothetical protein
MAKVPYENVHGMKRSPKGKVPWMEYNGRVVSDTQFCTEFLKKECDIDLDRQLDTKERAIARAFQKMMEENTYWTIALERWSYDTEQAVVKMVVPWIFRKWVAPRKMKKQSYAQGMGRHTEKEVMGIMKDDLQAVSDFLGEKKFMMGDNKASELDCVIFGFLSQMKWQSSVCVKELITSFPNLSKYCDRLRGLYWPDWDDCTTRGGTQDAKN